MLVTIVCRDKPGHLDLRMKTRPAHLEWIKASLPDGAPYCGPLFADDGTTFIGSIFIADFASLDAARAWHQADPYVKAGLFGQVTIAPSKNLAPDILAARG